MEYNSSELYVQSVSSNVTNTTPSDNIYQYPVVLTIALVITWIELVLILTMNAVLIIGILRKFRRNRLSFFVLHLAIADFGMGLFYLLPDAVFRTVGHWFGGEALCVSYNYISHVMPYVSSFMLVVISLDRVYVILKPLKSARRGTIYKYSLVGVSWILAFLLAIPQPLFSRLMFYGGTLHCDLDYPSHEIVKMLVSLFVCGAVFVPASLILICYTLIVRTIWIRINAGMTVAPKRIRNSMYAYFLFDASTSGDIYLGNVQSALGEITLTEYNFQKDGLFGHNDSLTTSSCNIMTRARIKSIIMTFVVVTVFVLCWSPFCINLLLTVYNVIPPGSHYYILMALAPINSAANPVVVMAFNPKILQRKPSRRQSCATSTTSSTLLIKNGINLRRIQRDDI